MLEGAKNYDNPCLDAVLLASSNAVDRPPAGYRRRAGQVRRMRWCVRCFWLVFAVLLGLRFVWG